MKFKAGDKVVVNQDAEITPELIGACATVVGIYGGFMYVLRFSKSNDYLHGAPSFFGNNLHTRRYWYVIEEDIDPVK